MSWKFVTRLEVAKETHTAVTTRLDQRQRTHDHTDVRIANTCSTKYDVITYINIHVLFIKRVLMFASQQTFRNSHLLETCNHFLS